MTEKIGIYAIGDPDPKKFVKVYDSPSAIDVSVFYNDKKIDSIQLIKFDVRNPFNPHMSSSLSTKVQGEIISAMLDCNSIMTQLENSDWNIIRLQIRTEYGTISNLTIEGLKFINYTQEISVNSPVIEEHLYFEADRISYFKVELPKEKAATNE